jgi:hypothetical protein
MDVDENPPASSGVKRTFLSSRTSSEPSAKHIKLDLLGSQLAAVNKKMNAEMEFYTLPDQSLPTLARLLPSVVIHLTELLARTGANFDEMFLSQANNLVESFTPEELDEWVNGFRNAMDTHDWSDFASHRTYIPHWKGGWHFDDHHSET